MPQRSAVELANRSFVTLIAAAGFIALQLIPLPGVTPTSDLMNASTDGFGPGSNFSVGCLGSGPVTSAFIMVEIAAFMIRPWRKLRSRDPQGRAKLFRAAVILALVQAGFQSFGVAMWLEGTEEILLTVSKGMLMLTISAAVAVSILLARWIDNRGLGAGFSVIIATDYLAGKVFEILDAHPTQRWGIVLPALAVATVFAAILHFNKPLITALRRLNPFPKEVDAPKEQPLSLRWPTCGLIPVSMSIGLLSIPIALVNLVGGSPGVVSVLQALHAWRWWQVAAVVPIALLVSRLFHPTERLLDLAACLGLEDRYKARVHAGLRQATVLSVGLAAASISLVIWTVQHKVILDVISTAILGAVAVDLVHEWLFRNRVGDVERVHQEHHVYQAELYADALRQGGIDAHIQGIEHRTLLHFFAPYVPLSILVAAEERERADGIVRGGVVNA